MVEGEPGDHGQQLPGLEAVGDELGLVGEGPMVVEDSLGMTGGAGGVLQEGRGVGACGHGLVNVGRLGELVWGEDLRGGGEGRQIQACGGGVVGDDDGGGGVRNDVVQALGLRTSSDGEGDRDGNHPPVHGAEDEDEEAIISGDEGEHPVAGCAGKVGGSDCNLVPQLTVGVAANRDGSV